MFESCLRNTVKAQDQCLALYFIYMLRPKSWNHYADKRKRLHGKITLRTARIDVIGQND